jgi:flagellar basal body-associated protein FliL
VVVVVEVVAVDVVAVVVLVLVAVVVLALVVVVVVVAAVVVVVEAKQSSATKIKQSSPPVNVNFSQHSSPLVNIVTPTIDGVSGVSFQYGGYNVPVVSYVLIHVVVCCAVRSG